MSDAIQRSIDQKRQESIKTGVALIKLLTPSEAAFWKEQKRLAVNAAIRRSYANNRTKEIADQIRKQRTPEGKAAHLYFNTLARARRWQDKELESALLDEKAQKGKAALVDVPSIMCRLGRGRKWRIKSVKPIKPKQPREKRSSKFSQLTRATIFERTKGGDTALHRAIKTGKFSDVPRDSLSLEVFLSQGYYGRTPLHYAVHFNCLRLIPEEFLTQQTLSVRDNGGNTPVHTAAEDGRLDEIPRKLLTPELMSTINNNGLTPKDKAAWRLRPASDRQKAFLTDLGASFSPSITAMEAFKLIPEVMQTRPVSPLQEKKLKRLGFNEPLDRMTAADASAKIDQLSLKRPTPDQIDRVQRLGLTITPRRGITAGAMDDILKLDERPPLSEQLDALRHYGLRIYPKSALEAVLITSYIRNYAGAISDDLLTTACYKAWRDPDFKKLAVIVSVEWIFGGSLPYAKWPMSKKREWLAAARKFEASFEDDLAAGG